jgi:tripartite-type tricarboxylate transporter receptor subunit TctC
MHALTGSKVTYIHYRGGSPAYAAVLSGQVDVVYANTNYMLPHVKSGKVKPLAVTGSSRSMLYPDLPTVQEQGYKDFEFASWLAYIAPARTPSAVVNKLSGEFAKAARQPDVVKKLAASDSTPIGSTADELRKTIASEIPRWAKVIKEANITLAN